MNTINLQGSPRIKHQIVGTMKPKVILKGYLRMPTLTKLEQRKILNTTENGSYEVLPDENRTLSGVSVNVDVPIPDGYVKPEGTLEITENGSYNVTEKAEVNVNTPPMQWQRPKDWLPYPEMSTEYDEIWMLVHVSKDYGGAYIWEIGDYTVDWGDGTIEEKSFFNNTQHYPVHCYEFSNLDKNTETDSGHRQIWCRAYRKRGTLSSFYIGSNYLNGTNEPQVITMVEMIVNTSAISVVGNVYSMKSVNTLQHIKVVGDTLLLHGPLENITALTVYLEGRIEPKNGLIKPYNSARIKYNDINYCFSNKDVTSGQGFAYRSAIHKIEVDCAGVDTLSSAFARCSAQEIVFKNTESVTSVSGMLQEATAEKVTGLTLPNVTNISNLYQNFAGQCDNALEGLQGEKILNASSTFYLCGSFIKIPNLIIPNCTNIQSIIQSEMITEVGLCDFSSVTNANNAFNARNLKKISFVEESIPITVNFANCEILDVESAKSIILGLKNYSGTEKEFAYTVSFHKKTRTLLENEGATAPDGGTWVEYAQSKGWNI